MNIPSNSSTVFSLAGAQKGKTSAANGFSLKKEQEEGEDFRVQSLQEQINSLRTKIQELDENKELDSKGKAELKQTLREQMTELTSQLQQRRLEVRQEKLDEEQKKAEERNPAAAEKPNRDRFTKKDGLEGLLSASDSVETAKIYQKAKAGKEQGARILEREAKLDSRTFSRVEIVGYRFKDLAKQFAEEKGGEAPNEPNEENAADEQGNFKLGLFRSPVFEKVFEKRSGAAIEEKLENAALLTAEARKAEENGIKALSEANDDPDERENLYEV